jgi:hypothetical protein
MKSWIAVVGLVLMLFGAGLPVHAAAAKLTEAEVKAFMTKMESATQSRNYMAVAGLMSPDISIHYLLNSTKKVDLTRDQFLLNAQMSSASYKDYQYRIRIQNIKLNPGKAVVSYLVYERATSTERGTIYCLMNDIAVVEKRNGQLMMSQLNGNGNMSKEKLF